MYWAVNTFKCSTKYDANLSTCNGRVKTAYGGNADEEGEINFPHYDHYDDCSTTLDMPIGTMNIHHLQMCIYCCCSEWEMTELGWLAVDVKAGKVVVDFDPYNDEWEPEASMKLVKGLAARVESREGFTGLTVTDIIGIAYCFRRESHALFPDDISDDVWGIRKLWVRAMSHESQQRLERFLAE